MSAVIYIIYITQTDFENRFSQLFLNVSFVETQKNVVYSKLMNNPFKPYISKAIFNSSQVQYFEQRIVQTDQY